MSKKISHIELSERKLLLRIVDILIIVVSLWAASTFLNFEYIDFEHPRIIIWLLTLAVYLFLIGEVFELYNLKVSNNSFLVIRSIFITTVITTLLYTFTPYISPSLPENRIQILYFFVIITVPVALWRFLYMVVLFSPKYFKTIAVIGHSSRASKMLELIEEKGLYNVTFYSSDKVLDSPCKHISIKEIDLKKLVAKHLTTEIVVSTTGFSSEVINKLNKQLIYQFENGINIKSFGSFYEELTDSVPKEYLDHHFYKNINFSKNNEKGLYLFLHRLIDVIISFIGTLFFLCILPVVVIGNLIGNRGPLFYKQERVGKQGEIFEILKLRSMVTDAEKNGAVWAKKNDSRITTFGRFLRLTRLDEIPQFYNILKGDMSLIGPRPERPEFVKDLAEKIPFYAIRHVVRPGLTGWAQVNYPYASTLEEQETKLRYDLFYIKERNAFIDFKILIKTINTVLFFKGQ